MALTAKQKQFVREYLVDLNATQAAIRAGYSSRTASEQAARLLANVKVQTAIQAAMDKRAEKVDITAEMVLRRWWDIATADPNDLVHLRRLCCRHCFGLYHEYQWLDEAEYDAAVASELLAAQAEEREPRHISDAGGYGFDRMLRPHPKCPRCRGEGRVDLHMADTKETTPQGRLLYAGIKQTRDGIEIKLQDQGKALENVARHLGMFKDKVELSGEDGGPINVIFSPRIRPAREVE